MPRSCLRWRRRRTRRSSCGPAALTLRPPPSSPRRQDRRNVCTSPTRTSPLTSRTPPWRLLWRSPPLRHGVSAGVGAAGPSMETASWLTRAVLSRWCVSSLGSLRSSSPTRLGWLWSQTRMGSGRSRADADGGALP